MALVNGIHILYFRCKALWENNNVIQPTYKKRILCLKSRVIQSIVKAIANAFLCRRKLFECLYCLLYKRSFTMFFFFFFRIDDIMTLAIPYIRCDGTSAVATSGGRGAVLPLTTTCAQPFWFTPTVVLGTSRNDKTTGNNGTRNNYVQT